MDDEDQVGRVLPEVPDGRTTASLGVGTVAPAGLTRLAEETPFPFDVDASPPCTTRVAVQHVVYLWYGVKDIRVSAGKLNNVCGSTHNNCPRRPTNVPRNSLPTECDEGRNQAHS